MSIDYILGKDSYVYRVMYQIMMLIIFIGISGLIVVTMILRQIIGFDWIIGGLV
jgi:hypothetical protein